jgi:predicted MFS family arabinose efflux permease
VVAIGGLAFGATRGQEGQWQDPVAFVALGVGAIATVAFPFLMARRPDPLVDLQLFRRRAFSTINLSTLLIYGAMYTNFGFQALFLQGVLGYTALGAAIVGLPTGVLLTLVSPRIGTLSGRLGARPFLAIGPVLMAAGLLWMLTVGSSSEPWRATLADSGTFAPPLDAIVGPLVASLLFGFGVSMMVAPLTTTLMGSVPVRNAGVASAINNALSRVGQPLVAAAVFIVVSGAFYSSLAAAVPGTDPSSPELRAQYQPLNPPPKDAEPQLARAAKEASTDAYHLAVIVGAGLLLAGAAVNWIGLRERDQRGTPEAAPP